jgi:hypothetical protein
MNRTSLADRGVVTIFWRMTTALFADSCCTDRPPTLRGGRYEMQSSKDLPRVQSERWPWLKPLTRRQEWEPAEARWRSPTR